MTKILAITWKELYTTFRDRNLILIMFLTPIVLSTIMGLAFGGLGGDDGISAFQNIPIAVVNLDEGLNLADQISAQDPSFTGTTPSLDDLEFEVGGETINLGEQLQSNTNISVTEADLDAGSVSFNFGDVLAGILLSEPITATAVSTQTAAADATGDDAVGGFDLGDLTCPLLEDTGDDAEESSAFAGSLEDLLDVVMLDDAAAARRAVDEGAYVAAVIIPSGFTTGLLPQFDVFADEEDDATRAADAATDEGAESTVEVYAGPGQPVSASIVRAVVEGVVNQLVRVSVALDAVLTAAVETLLESFNLETLGDLDLSGVDPALFTDNLQAIDASILDPLACLLTPGAGTIQLEQQPLDELQERSAFAFIMIILGSAQAIFFAMFTGIFGVNSIYQERDNWTLQRLIASPTPRTSILAGKLLGNIVVVTAQLLILFASFTVIASLVEGEPTFIWGTNLPALGAVILGIALFVSGLGVLVVGLAKTREQVQFVGPMVSATLGALGGSFGFRLPATIAGISPVWWGSEALVRVSNGEIDALGLPLLVLFGSGLAAFVVGTFFFRRRLDL